MLILWQAGTLQRCVLLRFLIELLIHQFLKLSQVQARIKEKALDRWLIQNQGVDVRRCPTPGCVNVLFSDSCQTCKKSFCWVCVQELSVATEKHEGVSCRDARMGNNPGNQAHKRYIEEQILLLRCPRCKRVFLDYSGCAALTCDSCMCGFCACCLKDCGNNAHPHLAEGCAANPNGKDYFIQIAQFQQIHRARFEKEIRDYLSNLKPTDRAAVLVLLQKSLSDLNITISN